MGSMTPNQRQKRALTGTVVGAMVLGVAVALLLFNLGHIDKPKQPVSQDTQSSSAPAQQIVVDPVCTVVGAGNPTQSVQVAVAEIDRLWGLYGSEQDGAIKANIAGLHSAEHPDPAITAAETGQQVAATLLQNFNQFTSVIANYCLNQ